MKRRVKKYGDDKFIQSVNGDTSTQTRINNRNRWGTMTEVSHISNMSPPVTVMASLLYRGYKMFGSTSLQTHMRSEILIFND